MRFTTPTIKMFEKKLGSYYLVDMVQDNVNNKLIITLYKKWEKHLGYEATDNVLEFDAITQREKALLKYNSITLKTLRKIFNWK